MRNYKNNSEMKYGVKPVQKVELSQKNITIRIVLFVVLLLIGLAGIGIFINELLKVDDGLQEIKSQVSGYNISEDFTFNYKLGESDVSATKENKAIRTIYDSLIYDATLLFDEYSALSDYHNLTYINGHLDEDIEVPEELYNALKRFYDYNSRNLFFAPIYEEYDSIMSAGLDSYAVKSDPNKDASQLEHIQKLLSYINDENHIKLSFYKNNVIKLTVSAEYQSFASQNEYKRYVTLGAYKNAFVIDYIAKGLIDKNYRNGFILSSDGFFRNLNDKNFVNYNLVDYVDNEAFSAANMKANNNITICSYKAFPHLKDSAKYYIYEDKTIASKHVDKNGLNTHFTSNLICYGYDVNCVDLAFKTYELYLCDSVDNGKVSDLKTSDNIYSIYFDNYNIVYNQDDLELNDVFDNEKIKYNVVKNNG